MADNELSVVIASGATKTLRDRDISGNHAQKIDVAPWMPTVVAGSQYNVTISSSVAQLTLPANATHALLTVDGADVRFTEDGSDPTSVQGLILKDGTIAELACPNPLRFIRVSTTDAKLNVTYRRYI
jgi:hypothetical protein